MIELHPQPVQPFKDNLDCLAEVLTNDDLPDLELTIESVVKPRKAGEEHEVRIKGYLASPMAAEMSAVLIVAT